MSGLASTIEAILYLKAQALSIAQIAEFAGCDRKTAEEGLMELMSDYAHRDSALEVIETASGYSLQLREKYQHLVNVLIPADLGVGALRTLAVIALKGPITQTELVDIRGSGVYQHVPELVEQGFVRKRKQADGRSSWVQVTDKFHQYFQINQLPQGVSELIRKRSEAPPEVDDSDISETEETEIFEELVISESEEADRLEESHILETEEMSEELSAAEED
jgi:segregation and condensation protein B